MGKINEIEKLKNYSREEKIEFYENVLFLVELGNTKIYEYKKVFGFDNVDDKQILVVVQKTLDQLIHNYRQLFSEEESNREFQEKIRKSQIMIKEEFKKISSYFPSVNNLPISLGYIDKVTKETVMMEITEEDKRAAYLYLYRINEYICAATVKKAIKKMMTKEIDKDDLLEQYKTLTPEEKDLLTKRSRNISDVQNDFKRVAHDMGEERTAIIQEKRSTTNYKELKKTPRGKYKILSPGQRR